MKQINILIFSLFICNIAYLLFKVIRYRMPLDILVLTGIFVLIFLLLTIIVTLMFTISKNRNNPNLKSSILHIHIITLYEDFANYLNIELFKKFLKKLKAFFTPPN